MKKLLELKDRFEKLQAELRSEGEKAFKEAIKELFTEIPSLKTIKWIQYTPYFNDGDTCEFSVNEPVFSSLEPDFINSWGDYEGEEEQPENSWISKSWKLDKNEHLQKKEKELLNQFGKFITSSTGEDLMLQLFEDHAEITCTKDSIEVTEYQHD